MVVYSMDEAAEKLRVSRRWLQGFLSKHPTDHMGQPFYVPLGNRRRKSVGQRSLERYEELLKVHVLPTLGARPLQQIRATEIDTLYAALEGKISARTAHHVHSVLNACIGAAVRTRKLSRNPMLELTKIPAPGEADHGIALDEDELRKLIQGFRGHPLFEIVSVAALTGARRGEVLALRWADLDAEKKTLRFERSIDDTNANGLLLKGPKREDHKRTIRIDDELVRLLLEEREQHARLIAGVPAEAPVNLSLVKLPDGALMFPSPPRPGKDFDLTAVRNPDHVTKAFGRKASKIGFDMRFHDLRGSHETILLDAGVPLKTVADRCGHDPVTLLRSYAKRSKKADTQAAAVIGILSKDALT